MSARRPRLRDDSGQASVEWTGVVLVVALALAGLLAAAPVFDGRSFGGFLAHRIVCAVRACDDGHAALARAYGSGGAALVRAHAPNLVYEPGERQLPVDWRRCREPRCAEAADDPDLDAHRSGAGARATAFTRVLRRGRRTYIQYWLYYPDSNSTVAGSDRIWEWSWVAPRIRELLEGDDRYPGFHEDDWESYHVRLDPDGSAWVRASSHGRYQGCRERSCRGRWTAETGWTRVSRGSHAGHIPLRRIVERRGRPVTLRELARPGRPEAGGPYVGARHVPLLPGRDLRERTSTAEGLRLIPLETHDRRAYRRRDPGIAPPWDKRAYEQPESGES